jgi:hypothetical protein
MDLVSFWVKPYVEPHQRLSSSCQAPPVQSTRLKPEAVCEAEDSVVAVAVAFAPAFELWYYGRFR